MPFGTRAPSLEKRRGSWRKSTTSCSSAAASSTPAMSSQVTDDFEDGSTSVGLTRGMSDSDFHIRQTSSPRKISGSHVRR